MSMIQWFRAHFKDIEKAAGKVTKREKWKKLVYICGSWPVPVSHTVAFFQAFCHISDTSIHYAHSNGISNSILSKQKKHKKKRLTRYFSSTLNRFYVLKMNIFLDSIHKQWDFTSECYILLPVYYHARENVSGLHIKKYLTGWQLLQFRLQKMLSNATN